MRTPMLGRLAGPGLKPRAGVTKPLAPLGAAARSASDLQPRGSNPRGLVKPARGFSLGRGLALFLALSFFGGEALAQGMELTTPPPSRAVVVPLSPEAGEL